MERRGPIVAACACSSCEVFDLRRVVVAPGLPTLADEKVRAK